MNIKKNRRVFVCLLLLFFTRLDAQLVNPNATPETIQLKELLDSIYGQKIISGQMDDAYLNYIIEVTGKEPAMMGYDFNGICPTQSGNRDAEKAINWVKNKGGIAQFQWHWISPNGDGDFYTKNFILDQALANPSGSSYKNIIRDIDLAAVEIKKMQNAGVPILWRPLHEAEGKWFWWGMSGGKACKELYRLMYDRLTLHHGLNNLIWVWTSYGTTKENWYPGDDVVDMIVWDYPDFSSSTGSWKQFQQLFGNKGKLFGIGEDGKVFDPDLFSSQPWLYFLTWAYMVKPPSENNGKNPKDWLFRVYNDSRVLTLDDLQPGPKADAGISQTLFDKDGDGFETVQLDGSGSSTDSGSILSYTWRENGKDIATGVNPKVSLKLGTHRITLTIRTSENESKSDAVVIVVKPYSLSLNKTVRVSSTESGLGNVPAHAVDGLESTRWSSAYYDPQWFQIDLDSVFTIDRVLLNWQNASAKNYRIDVSVDGNSWQTLRTLSNMRTGARVDSLKNLNGSGRHIRMYGTARTTQWGYSIFEFEVYGTAGTSFVGDDSGGPQFDFQLRQNYPNPFNPKTTIEYSVSESGHVNLDIYNPLGQRVDEILNSFHTPGHYAIEYSPDHLASGLYFCRLQSAKQQSTIKIHVLR